VRKTDEPRFWDGGIRVMRERPVVAMNVHVAANEMRLLNPETGKRMNSEVATEYVLVSVCSAPHKYIRKTRTTTMKTTTTGELLFHSETWLLEL
jgi:hypothetical protein